MPGSGRMMRSSWRVRLIDAHSAADFGAGLLRLLGEPCQETGGIGGQEVIARRGEIDEFEVRRIEAYGVDGAGQMRRRVDFLAGLLHQNAGGVDARGGMALRFENDRAKPARRGSLGAKQARKACADNGEIEIFQGSPPAVQPGDVEMVYG